MIIHPEYCIDYQRLSVRYGCLLSATVKPLQDLARQISILNGVSNEIEQN